MSSDALSVQSGRLRDWCVGALGLWANCAIMKDGSWVEHLHADGRADHGAERRWRVLARQVYCYATASRLGWFDGTDVAQMTYKAMWAQGWKVDGQPGFVHRILPDGTISDDRRDLYDHAFYLLASTALFHLTQDEILRYDIKDVVEFIETLAHPAGGWREGIPDALPRRQNPHMHLLEASLALFKATSDRKDLRIARHVIQLFQQHFFDKDSRTITEFFDTDWTPNSTIVEPGHAMEWVWLLGQYMQADRIDMSAPMRALYMRARHQRGDYLNDEEDRNGEIIRETRRAWVQTEVIKAHLAMSEIGDDDARGRAAHLIERFMQDYLTPDYLWRDQLNACGGNVATTIPVSTMYHIICMASEAERIASIR